ncbi:hypothetical protein CYLTODRAFT_414827 [Cylindrobasidium torrendii FP15055 ss-10]|uniref:Uncharacterized protein n=1 Tax=Cylindrobasidium torrendii FP15055 ss-10 TaxID=1314674 RepID=A0A0D7AWD7_9AGAR|nr:hypothetical protein CYLTODRAFT_414827 [Cylindrobasidium torrendii FP15055 ss-10]
MIDFGNPGPSTILRCLAEEDLSSSTDNVGIVYGWAIHRQSMGDMRGNGLKISCNLPASHDAFGDQFDNDRADPRALVTECSLNVMNCPICTGFETRTIKVQHARERSVNVDPSDCDRVEYKGVAAGKTGSLQGSADPAIKLMESSRVWPGKSASLRNHARCLLRVDNWTGFRETGCRSALPALPKGAETIWTEHFKKHSTLSGELSRARALALLQNYPGTKPEVVLPEIPSGRNSRMPFEVLPILNGHGCGHCSYAAKERSSISRHTKEKHNDVCQGLSGCPSKCGRKVTYQILNKSVRFQVAIQTSDDVQMMQEYADDRAHRTANEVLYRPSDGRKISPYLLHNQWMDFVDGKKPFFLCQQSQSSGLPDNAQCFLVEHLERYFNGSLACIRIISDGLLKQLRYINPNSPIEVFQPINEGKRSYLTAIKRVVFCILWQCPPGSQPVNFIAIPKDEALQAAVQRLVECITAKEPSAFDTALDSLFTSLWHRPSYATQGKPFLDPTLCCICLMHLNQDGSFDQSQTTLTRVVYFMRLFVVRRLSQLSSARAIAQEPPVPSAHDILGWLSIDTNSTFRYVWSIYTFKQNPMVHPRTWPTTSNPVQSVRHDGKLFQVATLRSYLHTAHKEWFHQWLEHILLGSDGTNSDYILPLNAANHPAMQDNMDTSTDGVSVFTLNRTPVLPVLHNLRAHLVGRMTCPADWHVWFKNLAKLEGQALILCMLEHSPGRAFELHKLLVANSYGGELEGQRAVFWHRGHLILVSGHRGGRSRQVPQGLSGFVSWALLQIHSLARPIAEQKVRSIFPEHPGLLCDFRTRLFMAEHSVWTTEKVTKLLENQTEKVFGWPIKVESMRQILTTLHRDAIPDANTLVQDELFQVVAALQAAHSKERQDNSYAVARDTVAPGIHWSKIAIYLGLSQRWQRYLLVSESGVQVLNGLDT